MELVLGEVQSNAKGGKYLPIKGKDGSNNPTFRSTAAVGQVTQRAASMFGKPFNQAQMQERFQSCLKTSAQGLNFLKLKAKGPGGGATRGSSG